jgi:hypothetical protein
MQTRSKSPNVIVILTHRSGINFLWSLLKSFRGYDKYPILVVVSDYKDKDQAIFSEIKNNFSDLPIELETIESNSFEFGGLYTAYHKTRYDEFLLLSHSCEIVNTAIFDIVFETYKSRSVAFGLQNGNWREYFSRLDGHTKKFVLKHIGETMHRTLIDIGEARFWQGHIGKYRRAVLDKMVLPDYLPRNMIEAICKSELLFTSTYHSLDESTVVLFQDWRDGDYEDKFGKRRLKIANEYIIKWKTHWSPEMVFDEMRSAYVTHRARKLLTTKFPRAYSTLKRIKNIWDQK